MKTKFAATALILASTLVAGTTFAADNGELTREQVRSSVMQARADGSLAQMNEGFKNAFKAAAPSTPSTLTRDAVKAEYFAAKEAGTLPPVGERGDLFTVQPVFASTRSRNDVRAEAVVAARMHPQEFGG